MKVFIKKILSRHKPCNHGNVIVFSSPRGGSTWVTELVASLPGFWPIHEPFNVRTSFVRQALGITEFSKLYDEENQIKVKSYCESLFHGHYPELKLRPGNRFYRPFTTRIVVKQNQGLLDRINWFADTFDISGIHLIRHPIAVALSREVFPFLDGFSNCHLRACFTVEQLQISDQIISTGSHLEKGVLAWCLHHGPALHSHREDTLLLSYEHCIMCPEVVIGNLLDFLGEKADLAKMKELAKRPSGVIRKSDAATQALLHSGRGREEIIDKWRKRVSATDESHLLAILEDFGIDIYRPNSSLPLAWRDWNFDGTKR